MFLGCLEGLVAWIDVSWFDFFYSTHPPFRGSFIALLARVCQPFLLHLLSSLPALGMMLGLTWGEGALPFLCIFVVFFYFSYFISFAIVFYPIYVCPFLFMPLLYVK